MHNTSDAGRLTDYPPQVVLQALLANNLTSFTQFAFGVVRPGITFKRNWHFEAVAHKLSQVANGDVRRLIITLPPRTLKSLCASVALPGLVPRTSSVRARRCCVVLGISGAQPCQ